MQSAYSLYLGLCLLAPAPLDSEFTISDKAYVVVGSMKRPGQKNYPEPIRIPGREIGTWRDVGWAGDQDFDDIGAHFACVVRGQDGKYLLASPLTVYLWQGGMRPRVP